MFLGCCHLNKILQFSCSASVVSGLGSFVVFQNDVGGSSSMGQSWQHFWPSGDQDIQVLPCHMFAEHLDKSLSFCIPQLCISAQVPQ